MKEPFFFFKNPWDVLISMLPVVILVAGFCVFNEIQTLEMPEEQRLQIYAWIQYSWIAAGIVQLVSIILLFAGNRHHLIGSFFAIPFKLIISLIPTLCLAGAIGGIIELMNNEQASVPGGAVAAVILLGPLGLFLCYLYCKRSKSRLKDVMHEIKLTDVTLLLLICTAFLAAGIYNARKEAIQKRKR